MAEIYKVDNIEKAYNIAKRLQLEGKYNLFRGQAQDWRVVPTAGRLSSKQHSESFEKLKRLLYYFSTENSLKKYCRLVDSFYAIAQHYGLATNYIDFTTNLDVAFYFATNSKQNKAGENCSIVCLNEENFTEFMSLSKPLYKNKIVVPPYIAKVNVDNLWRLQAQSGCFLFTPFANIEALYDFDRIIFPFTENFKGLSVNDIYPTRKSEIEILLDLYFDTEKSIEGSKRLEKFFEENNLQVTRLSRPNNYNILKKKEIHNSWKSSFHRQWDFQLNETLSSISGTKKIELFISKDLNLTDQIEQIKTALKKQFLDQKITRNTFIDFAITYDTKLSSKLQKSVIRNTSLAWEGTRNLPYNEDEIINIIGTYLSLEMSKKRFGEINYSTNDEELITLELVNKYGGKTRCKASPSKIEQAFRGDINDIVIDSMPRPISSQILLQINTPRYIFDFNKLLDLFKTELVAYQLIENSENNTPVIFFSPSQLKTIGYA